MAYIGKNYTSDGGKHLPTQSVPLHYLKSYRLLHILKRMTPLNEQITVGFALLVISCSLIRLFPLESSPGVQATIRRIPNTSTYIDAVIVLDNVSQIAVHDPDGDRYNAAQLFVDLTLTGDQIGTVKISSSQNPTQASGFHGLTNMDDNGKENIKHVLSPQVFGPVEGLGRTDVPAYITPALQTAGNMLIKSPTGNRRYVIVVTDAVALSGDQNDCPDAPQFHKWFCAVRDLEQEGVSVVLIGFTRPGSEAALIPTRNYIEAHGGTVLPVEDGAGLAHRLALAYTDILTRIHPTMFSADLPGAPASLTIDPRDQLTNVTFVALGNAGVSLASLQAPSGTQVAGKNTSDGSFYASAPAGSGYWLEAISSGTLEGSWHLTSGGTAPTDIFVIAVSAARFDLRNPAPADPVSDVSVRYIPAQGPIVLRARITDAGGGPIITVPFVANPLSDAVPFTTNALPGHEAADVDAILQTASSSENTFQVGLGNPLVPGVYLTKSFRIVARQDLNPVQLTVPVPTLLAPGASIRLNAQGATGDPAVTSASLSIYGRDPAFGTLWQPIASGGSSATGDFTLLRGCGITYIFIAISEVVGQLANGQYDYISYVQQPYRSELQQVITGRAILYSGTYLEWTPSQSHWLVTFTSTTCTPQTASLDLALHGNGFSAPQLTIISGQGYSVAKGAAAFTVSSNTKTSIQITADVGGCTWSPFEDRTASLQLIPTNQPLQGGPIVQEGTWQTTTICPSGITNARRYWLITAMGFLLFTILLSNGWQGIRSLFSRPYLDGKIEFVNDASNLLETDDEADAQTAAHIPVHIPRWRHSPVWYMDRRNEGTNVTYLFEQHESAFSLLKFSVQTEDGGRQVKVEATRYATGEKTPMFQIMQTPIGQEGCQCDGEPISIGQDIIYPEIIVLPEYT